MQQIFAHLSDPHLTSLEQVSPWQLPNKRILGYLSWRRKRRFEHRREVLDVLVTHLREQAPQHTVLTGDLTHIGMPDEFRQAAQWLPLLEAPENVSLVPGNHECYVKQDWEQGLGQWQDYLGPDIGPDKPGPRLEVRGGIAFIGLNSACPTPPLMASGSLGEAQLQALQQCLRETREQGLVRVVYLHHSPVPGAEKWRKRLTDAAPLSGILATEGAELVLHGHDHRARQEQIESTEGIIPVLAVPSASARGLYGADVARYHLFQVQAGAGHCELQVDAWQYQESSGQMVTAGNQTLELQRGHLA